MSDDKTPEEQEKEVQAQHVMQTALGNLDIVIDQLQSLDDKRVDNALEALDTAKTDLNKVIKT